MSLTVWYEIYLVWCRGYKAPVLCHNHLQTNNDTEWQDLKSLEEYLKFLQRSGEWCLEGGTTLESIQVPSHPFCPMLTNSSKEDTGEQIRLVLGLPLSRSF